jgi:hypothetical protein
MSTPIEPDIQVVRVIAGASTTQAELRIEERLASDLTARWERRGSLGFPLACLGDAIACLQAIQAQVPPPAEPAPPPAALTPADRDLLERAGLRLPR